MSEGLFVGGGVHPKGQAGDDAIAGIDRLLCARLGGDFSPRRHPAGTDDSYHLRGGKGATQPQHGGWIWDPSKRRREIVVEVADQPNVDWKLDGLENDRTIGKGLCGGAGHGAQLLLAGPFQGQH